MDNQKSYFGIIPANVRYNENLPDKAKLLYSELTALCNEKGYCWATNDYFSQLYKVHKNSISRLLSSLSKGKYIKIVMIYKKGSMKIEQRRIYLGDTPVNKNDDTYKQNCEEGINKNDDTPINKIVKDKEQVFNNTSNNTNNNSRFPEETDKNFSPPKIKKTQFDQNPDNLDYFNQWSKFAELQKNKLGTVKRHWKKKYNSLISDYEPNDIFYAIDKYAFIKSHPDLFWFEFDWPIWDFIGRGLIKFLSHAKPVNNFRKKYKNITDEMVSEAQCNWSDKYYYVQEEFTRKE